MMLEQHPPPKISEKMDCGGGMGKKEGEEKGRKRGRSMKVGARLVFRPRPRPRTAVHLPAANHI